MTAAIPKLYSTEKIPLKEKTIYEHWAQKYTAFSAPEDSPLPKLRKL